MLQQIFLSYTYDPHPVHAGELARLESASRRIIEAMGCRVADGKDRGGAGLTRTLEARIEGCDVLVAQVTPQADANGVVVAPRYAESEINFARGKIRSFALVHTALGAAGL